MTVAADVQQRTQRVLDHLVESGRETGLQAAAYRKGELVAHAVAGVADRVSGAPVTEDTLFHSFSTAKGVTATVAHVLAGRGLIDYDKPIAEYWPDFGAHGKHGITLRQVLTHSAGVPHLPQDTTSADLSDWDGMCARVAGLTPMWEPGTLSGSHGWTFGWVIGEVVRRATGMPMSTALHDYVARPLGVGDSLFFGVPDSAMPRLATLVEGNWAAFLAAMPDSARLFLASPRTLVVDADLGNDKDYLRADIPAAGTMTAEAAARMYAAVLGEVDGVRLLSAEQAAQVRQPVSSDIDQILGHRSPKTLGYFAGLTWLGGSPASFGTTGSGGSAAFADPAHDIAFALTKNRLTAGSADGAAAAVVREIYAALGIVG
ncbi:serine hydrolase domain-containing protein [Streptomyces flavidovirens]|uniref:serine hydrolase domain-containing protein n=1 Tax=Streptomyces flavidovirens TaxID=67298 RepID=UPI003414D865